MTEENRKPRVIRLIERMEIHLEDMSESAALDDPASVRICLSRLLEAAAAVEAELTEIQAAKTKAKP